jgi:hypothetical protein
MPVVTFDAIVEVLRCPMLNAGEDHAEGRRVAFRLVGREPRGHNTSLIDGTSEEALCSPSIAPLRKVSVDYLPILINGTVDIGPTPLETDICLIDPPFCANCSSVRPRSFAKEREEPLDPAVDRAAVNNETALSELLDNISITQPVADVPPHRQCNHIIGEVMVRKRAR